MDYLSIGNPLSTNFTGLRALRPEYFKDRCRLDAAKFTPLAFTEAAFNGDGSIIYKGKTITADVGLYEADTNSGLMTIKKSDSLANTGYSYLTPSIVEFSDPSVENNVFNYIYSAFHPQARAALADSELPFLSDRFDNYFDYDGLLIALMNLKKNKQNYIDSDITDAFRLGPGQIDNDYAIVGALIEARETYKRLAEQYGLTLHAESKHNEIFAKPAGPTKQKASEKPSNIKENYPLMLVDYSDKTLRTHDFIRGLMSSTHNPFETLPTPALAPYEKYSNDLPNVFKFYRIYENRVFDKMLENPAGALGKGKGELAIFNETISTIYNSNAINEFNPNHGAFLFFHKNLTARIEVYRGPSYIL